MKIIAIYKKLPYSFRSRVSYLRHRINSNRFLLLCISRPRHFSTVRKLEKMDGPINLRLGESRRFEDWFSTNYQVFCKHFLDATRPFSKNPILSYVVIDNVIEHLTLAKGNKMLENIFKSLKPGGILRIATPNLRELAKMYLEPDSKEIQNFREDFAVHNIDIKYPADLLKATYNNFGHHKGYIYDLETLSQILHQIGFSEISVHKPGRSTIPFLSNIETRISKSDNWGQLCIEAIKK